MSLEDANPLQMAAAIELGDVLLANATKQINTLQQALAKAQDDLRASHEVLVAHQSLIEQWKARAEQAETIVLEVAAMQPFVAISTGQEGRMECAFCREQAEPLETKRHASDCPWLMARAMLGTEAT